MFVATGFIGGKIADLVFQQAETTQSSAGTLTWTFTNANIGTAAADRYVIACIGLSVTAPATGSCVLSTVSIGGTNGTIHANANNSVDTSYALISGIAGRLVTSGTTATIVVTTTGPNMTRCFCRIYTMTRARSTTPTDTQTATANNASSVSDTINVPTAGALLVQCIASTMTGSHTMAGVTENSDINSGNVVSSTGHLDPLGANAAYAYSVTEAGSSNTPEWAMAGAVWQ